MIKKIKFALIINGKPCRSVEDLKDNFHVNDILYRYKDGTLKKWLSVHNYKDEYDKLSQIDENIDDKDILIKLTEMFFYDEENLNELKKDIESLFNDKIERENYLKLNTIKENFGINNLLFYFDSGFLEKWLWASNLDDLKSLVSEIDKKLPNREKLIKLIDILYGKDDFDLDKTLDDINNFIKYEGNIQNYIAELDKFTSEYNKKEKELMDREDSIKNKEDYLLNIERELNKLEKQLKYKSNGIFQKNDELSEKEIKEYNDGWISKLISDEKINKTI